MSRKYQHTQELLPQIKKMLNSGMPQQDVANRLWFTGKRPIHYLLTRERKAKRTPGCTETTWTENTEDIGRVQILKQAIENGSRSSAGFSLAHRERVKTCVKYKVIYRHRREYSISEMCRFFEVSRSGFYGYVSRMDAPANDLPLAEKIKEGQAESRNTYGYRRVYIWLERKGIHHDSKTILTVMN